MIGRCGSESAKAARTSGATYAELPLSSAIQLTPKGEPTRRVEPEGRAGIEASRGRGGGVPGAAGSRDWRGSVMAGRYARRGREAAKRRLLMGRKRRGFMGSLGAGSGVCVTAPASSARFEAAAPRFAERRGRVRNVGAMTAIVSGPLAGGL